ncbi:MAG: hypothetical protein WC635_15510 [Bacteriovorax sp.]|jgi:hypothetical protein
MKYIFLLLISIQLNLFSAIQAEETFDGSTGFAPFKKNENPLWPAGSKLGFQDSTTGGPYLSLFGAANPAPSFLGSPLDIELATDLSGTAPCENGSAAITDAKVSTFAARMSLLGGMSACGALAKDAGNRYTDLNCSLLVSCSKVKMSKDKRSFSSSQTLPKFVAEDFVGLKLDRSIVDMEKMEVLRKFAEEKFGKDLAPTCKPRFDHRSAQSATICDASVMDSGFLRMQKDCSVVKNTCYNKKGIGSQKDYKSFLDTHTRKSDAESVLQDYFVERTDATAKDALGNDDAMFNSIAAILSSKEIHQVKIQKIFAKLSELEAAGKLDPVFNYSSESISSSKDIYKKSPHFDFFEKLVQSTTNPAMGRKALEEYRKETAKGILNKSCENTPNFSDICRDATDILMARKVYVWDRNHAARGMPADLEDDRYETLKEIFPNGIQNLNDYAVIMDAQRCKAFSFVKIKKESESSDSTGGFLGYGGLGSQSLFPSLYKRPPEATDLWEETDYGFGSPSYLGNYSLLNSKPLLDSFNNLEKTQVKSTDKDTSDTQTFVVEKPTEAAFENVKKPEEKTAVESMSESFRSSGSSLNMPSTNPSTSNYESSSLYNNVSQFSGIKNQPEASDVKEEGAAVNPASGKLFDKIDELSKKLAMSEEALAKIKAEKVADEEQIEKQRKQDEENKTIADLKAKITSLKSEAKRSALTQSAVVSEVGNNPISATGLSSAARIESSVPAGDVKDKSIAAHDSGAKSRAAPAAAPSGEGASSAAIAASPAGISGGNGSSGDSRNGLVLTRIDGLSSEKAAEKIYEKIIELKGARFYIEENGVVMEIIPQMENNAVVKDKFGMPVFRKQLVTEAAKAKTVPKRAPASINSKAELLQSEDRIIERTRYLKLKEITEGIRKK